MPYGVPPPSQKNRPIAFRLTGGGASVQANLALRPEELSRTEPSQLAVQNTLGGAWADSWDRGISTIRLSGTTGWREVGGGGGEAAFANLRSTAFQAWHDRRAALIAGGSDPNAVEMVLSDALDNFAVLVAPKVFTLRRSKQRPLLMMYVIELLVLADLGAPNIGADPIMQGLAAATAYLGGAAAFNDAGNALGGAAGNLGGLFA